MDDISHELAELFQQQRKKLFPAEILDSGGNPLSVGQAIIEADPSRLTFWPSRPSSESKWPSKAAILHRLDGSKVPIFEFHPCTAQISSERYHSRLSPKTQ